jgi:hypothetical protein
VRGTCYVISPSASAVDAAAAEVNCVAYKIICYIYVVSIGTGKVPVRRVGKGCALAVLKFFQNSKRIPNASFLKEKRHSIKSSLSS